MLVHACHFHYKKRVGHAAGCISFGVQLFVRFSFQSGPSLDRHLIVVEGFEYPKDSRRYVVGGLLGRDEGQQLQGHGSQPEKSSRLWCLKDGKLK